MSHASPPTTPEWTARRVVLATLFVLFVALSFWLLYRFHIVIFILFVAIVLGTAIRPLVDRLHRLGISRALGVIMVYLLILLALVGFTLLVVPLVVEQGSAIGNRLPEYYETMRDRMSSSPSRLIQRLGRELPFQPPGVGPAPANAESADPDGDESLNAVTQALTIAGAISRSVFITLAILLLAFYWTLDGERTIRSLLLLVPLDRREETRSVINSIEDKLGAFIRGQAIVCFAVGALALIAYLLIGLPYALVLALIAGVMEAVPIIGPVLGAIPPALLALATDPSKLIWVAVATLIIQQLENSLLIPRVMKGSVGVNPLMTLLALAAFSSLLGLAGALMAIPMAAVIQILINRFVLDAEPAEARPSGRDRLSTLRYEVQHVVADLRKALRQKEGESNHENDEIEDAMEVIARDLDQILAQATPQEERA